MQSDSARNQEVLSEQPNRMISSRFCALDYAVIAAVCFNAFLAFVNANVTGLTVAHVALSEIAITGFTLFLIARSGAPLPRLWLFFVGFTIANFFFISLFSGLINPKVFRDFLIIHVFVLAGFCYPKQSFEKTLTFLTVIILFFMFLEGAFTEIFLKIFNIALYYLNTRGVGEAQTILTEGPSIFKNATGFRGRFSWGLFDTHRLSSIFLEQTSLGNFAMILTIYMSVFAEKISKRKLLFFAAAIFLILTTTNSRMALGFCGLTVLLHFFMPILPRYAHVAVFPALMAAVLIFFYDPKIFMMSDTMSGRFGWTAHLLTEMNLIDFFGFSHEYLPLTADSGISYWIISQGIIGVIAVWAFISFSIPQNNIAARRMQLLFAIYFYLNLQVGSSILSIKTGALLWLIFGIVYRDSIFKKRENEL